MVCWTDGRDRVDARCWATECVAASRKNLHRRGRTKRLAAVPGRAPNSDKDLFESRAGYLARFAYTGRAPRERLMNDWHNDGRRRLRQLDTEEEDDDDNRTTNGTSFGLGVWQHVAANFTHRPKDGRRRGFTSDNTTRYSNTHALKSVWHSYCTLSPTLLPPFIQRS